MTQSPADPPSGTSAYEPPIATHGGATQATFEPGQTPPVEPVAVSHRRRPNWPLGLGIPSLVYAAFVLLGSVVGSISMVAMNSFTEMIPEDQRAGMDAMMAWLPLMIGLMLVAAGLAVWQAVASIQLIRRKASGARGLYRWAIVKMLALPIMLALNTIPQVVNMQAIQAHTAQSGGSLPPGFEVGQWIGLGVGVVFGLIFGLAIPVFVLIWWRRESVQQDIAAMD